MTIVCTSRAGSLPALWPGLGNFGEDFAFFFGRAAEMIFRQAIAQKLESVFRAVDDFELVQVVRRNSTGVHEGLEVEDAVPVFAAIDDNQNLLGQLVGLRQREDLKQFVHGSESARKNDQGLGEIGEPEFTHEEIVELEIQRRSDVLVRTLFEGQLNVQAAGLSASLVSTQVGGFHDSGTSAGGNHETAAAGGNLDRPGGQHVSETARVFVVAGHFDDSQGTFQIF